MSKERKVKILESSDFDKGTSTADEKVETKYLSFLSTLKNIGFNVDQLVFSRTNIEKKDYIEVLSKLEHLSKVIFSQWVRSRYEKDKTSEFASARLFNSVTSRAREISKNLNINLLDHLSFLSGALQDNWYQEKKTKTSLLNLDAEIIDKASRLHEHNNSWLWCMLPTFQKQHYGRILLMKIETDNPSYPMFLTQPFFLSGEATLCHTHGQNWAISKPLGKGFEVNEHINTMWYPNSLSEAFPLREIDKQKYSSNDVVIIPPRAIHAISRSRKNSILESKLPSLKDFESNPNLLIEVNNLNYGNFACMHLYKPDHELIESLSKSPFSTDDNKFFIENDMIVFDHQQKNIWAGGGGAWAKRMIEFGTSGKHCGSCFVENDPRKENLNFQLVMKWLIDNKKPTIKKHAY